MNPYIPNLVRIEKIKKEVGGERPIRTFRVAKPAGFSQKPGQCAMVGLPGKGESMFAISCSPTRGYLEFSVMRLGKVTSALHQSSVGDTITVRGPYGNGFPVESWKGKNMVFVGGGIGQAPLRSIIEYVLDNRQQYGNVTVIYGARTTADLCYKDELFEMEKRKDASVHLSIDVKEEGWTRYVGFVPNNVMEVAPKPDNAIAITCGPPIMIKFVVANLSKLGFGDEQIYTTLEGRMKCGIGKCGRCNVGNVYICKDGPVFNYVQLKKMPQEY